MSANLRQKEFFVTRARIRIATTGIALAAALCVGVTPTSAGASTLGGTATITNPSNNSALGSGGSATTFTLALPAGAACTGDTANGGYHVFSYLVQSGTDVTTVTFTGAGPSAGLGLFDTGANYYGPANTAINTGQIVGIPNNFQWAPTVTTLGVPLSQLLYSGSSGVWDAGLVCANSTGHVTDYWSTRITFVASNSDANGFTWAAVPGVPADTPEVPLPAVLPVVGIAAAGLVVARHRRSRHHAQT